MTDNITLPNATVQQALEKVADALPAYIDGVAAREYLAVIHKALEQQAEPVTQRSDGIPTSKVERNLRRMLCVERHGGAAYLDDGEASYCGDAYYRSIDYMRESIGSIMRAWYDAGVKKLAGAQPEQQAEPLACGGEQEAPYIGHDCDPTLPDTMKVICPACCTQFRAIPTSVQNLMLDAGFEPPFTTPPQRKPLTDEEVWRIWHGQPKDGAITVTAFARAIEAAHGIKEGT